MKTIIKISNLEASILSVFTNRFDLKISILQLAKEMKKHYPNVYQSVKGLEKKRLLRLETVGKAKICSLNTDALTLPVYLAFVEELKAQNSILKKFPFFKRIVEEAKKISSVNCIGIFGSHVSGDAGTKSDIDIFILAEQGKLKYFKDFIPKYFPELENRIDLTIVSFEEFSTSLKSKQFTVSQEIAKNKLIFSGAEAFYQVVQEAYA